MGHGTADARSKGSQRDPRYRDAGKFTGETMQKMDKCTRKLSYIHYIYIIIYKYLICPSYYSHHTSYICIYIIYILVGLEHDWIMIFLIYWECHHPNWRTHIFQRGRYTTNQLWFLWRIHRTSMEHGKLFSGENDGKKWHGWKNWLHHQMQNWIGTSRHQKLVYYRCNHHSHSFKSRRRIYCKVCWFLIGVPCLSK